VKFLDHTLAGLSACSVNLGGWSSRALPRDCVLLAGCLAIEALVFPLAMIASQLQPNEILRREGLVVLVVSSCLPCVTACFVLLKHASQTWIARRRRIDLSRVGGASVLRAATGQATNTGSPQELEESLCRLREVALAVADALDALAQQARGMPISPPLRLDDAGRLDDAAARELVTKELNHIGMIDEKTPRRLRHLAKPGAAQVTRQHSAF